MSTTTIERRPLPEGQEWRRADELRVGDEFPIPAEAEAAAMGARLVVVEVDVKPRTVYITIEARALGFTYVQRVRPRRDDEFPALVR